MIWPNFHLITMSNDPLPPLTSAEQDAVVARARRLIPALKSDRDWRAAVQLLEAGEDISHSLRSTKVFSELVTRGASGAKRAIQTP